MEQTCIICQMAISPGERLKECDRCNSKFHQDCWKENGGCATYGCKNAPKVEKAPPPQPEQKSYWGATTKQCPMCGETIPVYATNCPHCHETFANATPITQSQIRSEKDNNSKTDWKSSFIVILIFVFAVLAITAPLTLFFGGLWLRDNWRDVKEEKPAFFFLAASGMIISIIYTLLFILAFIFG